MDTMTDMLSMLLGGAVETLDIAPDLQRVAIERYDEVGTWLAENGEHEWRIYPQGSFRLGTVVRPNSRTGEYDIDLVCWRDLAKESTTQAELKLDVGDMLHGYLAWKKQHGATDGPKTCEPRRRCWTLTYPDHGFHLDVLPAIPDTDHPPTGILLTDVNLRKWQHSNPIGYAGWFRTRSEELQRRLTEAAVKRHVNVADVPTWEIRSTLQRVVQVLKWHCMIRFARDPDNKPPSILITTLAALAYNGEEDLFTATQRVVANMGRFIEHRSGTWWIPNPAHPEENFADKWNEYPERLAAFHAWHQDITTVLAELAQMEGKGLDVVAARMLESFSADPVQRSVARYSDYVRHQREAGALRMGSTGLLTTTSGIKLPNHTFDGDHTNPRG